MDGLQELIKSFMSVTANYMVNSKLILLNILEWLRDNDYERQANEFESCVTQAFEDIQGIELDVLNLYTTLREPKYDPVVRFIEEKSLFINNEINRNLKNYKDLSTEESRYSDLKYENLTCTLQLLETMKRYIKGI